MKFYLLFDSTPLTPGVPLKALTSQGMRLDVACRMLRACVLGPDGLPSGHSVSAWFAGSGMDRPAIVIDIDGRELDARMAHDMFRSELVLARHLKATVAELSRGIEPVGNGGIHMKRLDEATSAPDAFLESIRREKHDGGKKIVLLHEHGVPILDVSQPCILSWKHKQNADAVIVIGNHQGFPAHVEEALLATSDSIFSIAVNPPSKETGSISYLGSHVVTFVQMFHPPV